MCNVFPGRLQNHLLSTCSTCANSLVRFFFRVVVHSTVRNFFPVGFMLCNVLMKESLFGKDVSFAIYHSFHEITKSLNFEKFHSSCFPIPCQSLQCLQGSPIFLYQDKQPYNSSGVFCKCWICKQYKFNSLLVTVLKFHERYIICFETIKKYQ